MQKENVDRGEPALSVGTGWSVPLGFHCDDWYVANSLKSAGESSIRKIFGHVRWACGYNWGEEEHSWSLVELGSWL